jgi:hypothetical protein
MHSLAEASPEDIFGELASVAGSSASLRHPFHSKKLFDGSSSRRSGVVSGGNVHNSTINSGRRESIEDNSSSAGGNTYYSYSQFNWEVACACLLVKQQASRTAKRTQNSSVSKSSESLDSLSDISLKDASQLLWTRVFKEVFVLQVERLLRHSCRKVLNVTRQRLLDSISAEGINMNYTTLDINVSAPVGGTTTSSSSMATAVAGDSTLLQSQHCSGFESFTEDVQRLSSARMYSVAESLRLFIESQYVALRRSVDSPLVRCCLHVAKWLLVASMCSFLISVIEFLNVLRVPPAATLLVMLLLCPPLVVVEARL